MGEVTEQPRRRWRRSVREVLVEMWREFSDDRVSGLAAEIAFFGALSVFPGLLVVASALGTIDKVVGEDVAADVQQAIVDQLHNTLGADTSVEDAVRDLFAGASPGVLTFGVLAAVYSASRGFGAIISALDIVYDHEEQRPWLMRRVVGLLLALGTFLVGASAMTLLVVGPLLGRGRDVADELGLGEAFATAWDWARVPLVVVVLALWAVTVYHVAPSHRSPWRWEVPGAVFSALGWVAVSFGLRYYLDFTDSGANALLGAIGGALSLLLWLFALAMVFLLGGELNAIIANRHDVSFIRRRPPRAIRRIRLRITRKLRRRRAG